MKKKLLITALCLGFFYTANSQTTYTYDFGYGEGVWGFTTTTLNQAAEGTKTTTGPDLEGPTTGGGTVRLKKATSSSTNGGVLELVTESSFGSHSSFKMTVPVGSGDKFAITKWTSPSKYAITTFKLKLGTGASGSFTFAMGNEDAGNKFTDGNNPTTGTAAAVRWNYGASAVTLQAIGASNTYANIDATNTQTFAVGNQYAVAVYSNNNSTNAITYTIGTTTYTLAASSYQVFINGTRLLYATGNYNFPKASIADDAVTDSFAFFGIGSTTIADASTAFVDDIVYGSFLPASILPVSLTSFTTKVLNNAVELSWSTASEQNNSHFDLEKSIDGKSFTKFATKTGAGNSNTLNQYKALDYSPTNGTNYYRLIQNDFDGNKKTYGPYAVQFGLSSSYRFSVACVNGLSALSINVESVTNGNAELEVTNTSGQKILSKHLELQKGINNFNLDDNGMQTGVYIVSLNVGGKLLYQKLLK